MLDWPNQVENGANLEFDVCIAGAGAAGITLALELKKQRIERVPARRRWTAGSTDQRRPSL